MRIRSSLKPRRRFILMMTFFIVAVFFACEGEPPANATVIPKKGAIAPDFTLVTLDGKNVTLSDYRGKVVFLNFWATWCKPCTSEMPAMENLHKAMKNQDFAMLAVSIDMKSTYQVKSFVNRGGYSFPVMHDVSKDVAKSYFIDGIPTTFIIDKKGVIEARLVGGRAWDSYEVVEYFKKISK